ncbi:hypothetical protein IV203_034003 [Nitzschia inconspicua]|uniref:Uncharacterized protein n=1 Tax=Nitzschia inconspicua TaxID=303405 RepID=A0A9K3M390_9STRA|nr:hypothetical protein IV203_034003 [Nitzschia inconspicua]
MSALVKFEVLAAQTKEFNASATSAKLDVQVENLSPGYLAALDENSSESEIRYDGTLYAEGTYEWCNSALSDQLCDSEWDAMCSNAFAQGDDGNAQRRVLAAKGKRYLKDTEANQVEPKSGRQYRDISAELDVVLERISPGFWGNYSLHNSEEVIRGDPDVRFDDDPDTWCQSENADYLSDSDWDKKCGLRKGGDFRRQHTTGML